VSLVSDSHLGSVSLSLQVYSQPL